MMPNSPTTTSFQLPQPLADWNATDRDYPRDRLIHELFSDQATRTPEAIAVEFGDRRLSYRELDARVEQLSRRLRQLGVVPDSIVALCFQRSIEMVVAIHAVVRAGGAYLPLDPEYPSERLHQILDESQPNVVLTHAATHSLLSNSRYHILNLDEPVDLDSIPSADHPAADIRLHHLAYVIYTSGSTGRPKGVMNCHSGILNKLLWRREKFLLTERDAVLQKTPYSFDVSVWEFFWPLISGARLVVAAPGGHRDPDYLYRLINQNQVTTIHFVPSMLQIFLGQLQSEKCRSLSRVFCSGEALSVATQDEFLNRMPGVELHNLYGPTEAAIEVTHWKCTREPNQRSVPIGKPIANTQMHVLDDKMQLVSVGVAGELYIGGVGVAKGYLNQPELTAEKFVSDPFSAEAGARLYRTGDLARWRTDGNLEFLGRIDDQVKIRGYRIELGEIESTLSRHEALSACVVQAVKGGAGEDRLVAYLVLRDEATRDGKEPVVTNQLRSWLAERLPEYMLPTRFVSLKELPMNSSGKVDRRRLSELAGQELGSNTAYRAPSNPLEEQLCQLWQRVLCRDRIGVDDHFLDLGGHSLLAVQIAGQLSKYLNRQVSLRWLFEYPTVARLAAQLASLQQADSVSQKESAAGTGAIPDSEIQPISRNAALPSSLGQRRMWLLHELLPDPSIYNVPFAWRLRGGLDQWRLRLCLQLLMQRHEILRTSLRLEEAEVVQVIQPEGDLTVDWQERVASEAELPMVLQELSRQPFDLTTAPLWRAALVKLSDEDQVEDRVLLLTFHHSIVDEWTLRLLAAELEQLYLAPCQTATELGRLTDVVPNLLPAQPIQFADYAAWERQRLTGENLAAHRQYWSQQLSELSEMLELPTDRPPPAQPSGAGGMLQFTLPAECVEQLRQVARRENSSLFVVLLAAFQVFLARYSRQSDIVVSTPLTQRQRPELQGLFGFFLNTLPIRTVVQSTESFSSVLRQVHQRILDAYQWSDLPFEQMVELCEQGRFSGQHPLHQVMFVLLEDAAPGLKLTGQEGQWLPVDLGLSKNDLTVSVLRAADGWAVQWEYSSELFDAASIELMAKHWRFLLDGIVRQPETAIRDLPLVSTEERRRMLADWNATDRDYPRDRLIHELFTDQAGQTPEAIAVEFGDRRLSYRQLDLQSDVAAERLNACGVGPGDLVGLCADRSLELIVALLGILKAGAAYVPLDSRLPQERLRQMVEDAGLRLILVAEADKQRIESVLELLGLEPCELVTNGQPQEPVTPSPCPLPRSGGEGSDAFAISNPGVESSGIGQNSQSRIESSGIGQKSQSPRNSGESHYPIHTNCGNASLGRNCQTKTLEELVASENGLSSAAEDRQDNRQDNDQEGHPEYQEAELHLGQRTQANRNTQSQPSTKSQLASARQMTADQWPAYVNYTSGSTGQPRGVLIPHRAVVRLVLGCNYVNLDAQETILHHSTLSFDASTFEIWGALLNGGRLVVMAPGQATLSEIGQVIREHGVTTLWLTAGLFHLMVDNRLEDLRPLRQLLAGGDVLSPSHVARVRRELPDCRMINGYGPTENTTFTCCYTVAEDYEESRSVPIGRPISNTRVYILDPQRQPVPIGVEGELYAGGDGLAIGYLNQPELTAEKFVSDPFSAEAGARLYRTGDLARWRTDGNLEFLGRIDDQVKIRGYRIELGEIESTLCRHEALSACVVQAVKGVAGEDNLVAYVVLRDVATRAGKDPVVTSQLRGWLAERLPEYMLPTRFVSLTELPLNSSGKVDRRRLKELHNAEAAWVEQIRVPKPDSDLESQLSEIWRRLLRRDSIGPEDNFFDLGGHSLLAARLASEIETNLGFHLRMDEIFRFQSISALAGRISGGDRQIIGQHIVPIQPLGNRPPLFCFHGYGGTAAHFAHLARHLGSGIPVYGLQAAGVDGKSDRHSTVEAMARSYAREIRLLTAQGPYYFAGHSIGGWIAFATALEIESESSEQCTLCLLDTQNNARVAGLLGVRQRSMILNNNIRRKLKRWLEMPANDKLSAVGRHIRSSARLMNKLHSRRGNESQRESGENWTLLNDIQEFGQPRTKDYYVQSVERYRPSHRVQDFQGDILVVVGTDQLHFPHQQFWASMTRGSVEVQIVQADHLSMMHRDESRQVAQQLRKLWPE